MFKYTNLYILFVALSIQSAHAEDSMPVADSNTLSEQIILLTKKLEQQSIVLQNIETKIDSLQKNQDKFMNRADSTPKKNIKKTPPKKVENVDESGMAILGAREWAWLDIIKGTLNARVDSGAAVSSLNALNVKTFERDGKDWVKFDVPEPPKTSKKKKSNKDKQPEDLKLIKVELPVARWAIIRQSSVDETTRRPVIKTWVQVGPLKVKTELTLTDRTHMQYPLLLGRSFFKDIAVIDVSKSYLYEKHEPEKEEKKEEAKTDSKKDKEKK